MAADGTTDPQSRIEAAPLGLFGSHLSFERGGRPRTVADLAAIDVLGFDRNDALLRAYAAHGLRATREDFPIRCDDQMVSWDLMLAGAGLGLAQVLPAARLPPLEQAEIGLRLAPLPVWLVLHEEVRGNARIRRVADFFTDAIGARLQGG